MELLALEHARQLRASHLLSVLNGDFFRYRLELASVLLTNSHAPEGI